MRNRKILLMLLLFSMLLTPLFVSHEVLAAKCGDADTIILECEGEGGESIFELVKLIVSILSVGAGIVAVIGISITGVQWMTAGGNEQAVTKAKRRLYEIILGVALYATAYILLNWLYITPQESLSSGQSATNTSQSGTKSQTKNNTKSGTANPTKNNSKNGNNGSSKNSGGSSNNKTSSAPKKYYMGTPLEHYTSIKDITASMIVEHARSIMNFVHTHMAHDGKKDGWTYGDSHGMPPGSDGYISCDRLASITLYTLGFTDQPPGGYTIGNMFPWLKKLGFKESHSLNDIKRGSIVWLKYDSGTSGGHVFVVADWNRKTGIFTRYDAGKYWNHSQPITTKQFPYNIVGNNYNAYLRVFNLPK